MLYSKKGNFIFISYPKTATTAFQKVIKAIDESATTNSFPKEHCNIKIPEHSTALKIKNLIGDDYESTKKICFVRNPYEKVVSAYFFLKNGKPLVKGSIFNYNDNLKNFFYALITQLKIYLAKILPFEIWSILYPFKKNLNYILDDKDEFLVNYICKTETIIDDLMFVFDTINYEKKNSFTLKKINISKHNKAENYFHRKWHKKLFEKNTKEKLNFINL